MNRIAKIATLLITAFSLAFLMGCEPTVDATDEDTMEESVEEIEEELTDEEAEEFAGALIAIGMAKDGDDEVREAIDGKTADQIIAYADELDEEEEGEEEDDD